MRHVFGIFGVLAAAVLIAVSAAMNWRFGYSLGRTEVDGLIYGSASVAADILKALVPFFFFGAVRKRVWSQACAAAAVGIVVTAYSLASALGHAAINRNDTTSHRQIEVQTYNDLYAELVRARERLSWIGAHRAKATVASEIEGLKGERNWKLTDGCMTIDKKTAREFCQRFRTLEGELGSAREAEELEASIANIQAKITSFRGSTAMGDADPQASVLAKLLGLPIDQIQFGLTIFVAILLEVGSGMGMYMAFSAWRDGGPSDDKVPPDFGERSEAVLVAQERRALIGFSQRAVAQVDEGVRNFLSERVRDWPGGTCSVTAIYEAYLAWCDERSLIALAIPSFVRELSELGIHKKTASHGMVYANIRLLDKSMAVAVA